MHNIIRRMICITSVLILAIPLLTPYNAMADDGSNEGAMVKPNIVIQTNDWLVVTYGEKVPDKFVAVQQLDSFVMIEQAKMWQDFTGAAGGVMRDGSNYWIKYGDQIPFGNSYVQTNWGTSGSWAGGSAEFGGWSSSAWYGTVPDYNCDAIIVEHTLTGIANCYVTSAPSDWDLVSGTARSPTLWQEDTWYYGTGWSGLSVTYGGLPPSYLYQFTWSCFYWDSGQANAYTYGNMGFGY